MPKTPAINTLFYGDNLAILREYIDEESVDLNLAWSEQCSTSCK
jgi:hypothetical protein